MPSLRKRVSSYFRQLSFYNEPREKKNNINENSFITKYLEGHISLKNGPPILYGKNATDLPNYDLGSYHVGPETIIGCYSGPNGGLTTVKRLEKHLSVPDTDIDFIDTPEELEARASVVHKSPVASVNSTGTVDNSTMVIKVAGQEYLVTNVTKNKNKSHSLGSLNDFDVEIEKTKICQAENNNSVDVKCKNQSDDNQTRRPDENRVDKNQNVQGKGLAKKPVGQATNRSNKLSRKTEAQPASNRGSYGLAKSKSEGNPFQHKKRGKIIQITTRPTPSHGPSTSSGVVQTVDPLLPQDWNRSSSHIYGISDSLYDKNQVTKNRNGDPIADCFGIIARNDSAILAVADGVNWGERASIAAKSAVHGCLHYLNKTIFNDTKPFDDLCSDAVNDKGSPMFGHSHITNTREVFVCLLRAFNCAHDLILENEGMLTTLTVAVVLPLRSKSLKSKQRDSLSSRNADRDRPWRASQRKTSVDEGCDSYVCCVCNVGDTLAYVYSQKYGVRELTKGSHDVNCNRDMRDALGALGPVDGINPELSNLTLSITTMQKGDIILVASDGLTDNFDPNVCKFTVNSKDSMKMKRPSTTKEQNKENVATVEAATSTERKASAEDVPVKPPRKHKASEPSEAGCSTREPERKQSGSGDYDNPLIEQFMRQNSLDTDAGNPKSSSSQQSLKPIPKNPQSKSQTHKTASRNASVQPKATEPKRSGVKTQENRTSTSKANTTGFLRSKTTLEMRTSAKMILRNEEGVPYVTPMQRYEISLLLMEDILRHGISGHDSQCTTAKQLCENLVNFTFSISSAKRNTLEDSDLYYDNADGVLVEVSQQEKKLRRKKGLERVQNLPGKLDHVSVVAYNVGNYAFTY